MDTEIFSGHLVQIDYENGLMHRLHLRGLDGRNFSVYMEPPPAGVDFVVPWNGSIAFFDRGGRSPVRIVEEERW